MDQVDYELMHYGILGMKWGKRKINPDGSLTPRAKAQLSKKYKKESVKALKTVTKTSQKRYLDAYNKTADEYNNGKIDAFNKKHKPTSANYMDKYMKQFNKDLTEKYNKMTVQEIKNNKHYQKGKELCDKYNMTSFDKLAKENINLVEKYKM